MITKLFANYKTSVYRRTILQALIIVPGFGANFLIYFFAGRYLSSDGFGIFYVAVTIGNVLVSGSLILNIFFTRHLVRLIQSEGKAAAHHAIRRIENFVISAGFGIAILTYLVLWSVSSRIGVQSQLIILLIILDAYTNFVGDLGRVFFQSMGQAVVLGLYTTVWLVLRFLLCMSLILIYHTAWAGLLGAVLSAVVMITGFRIWISFSLRTRSAAKFEMPSATTLLIPTIGYSLLIVASNMDVMVSYFVLTPSDLGTYSASSVLPKAILVVMTPLLQMLFPRMVGTGVMTGDVKNVIAKIIGVTVLLAGGAALFIWILSGWLCGGTWGLKLCQESPMSQLLLAAVPMSLLRALVMLTFARARDGVALWLVVPVLGYFIFSWNSTQSLLGLANGYAWASTLTIVFYLAVSAITHYKFRSRPLRVA